MIKLIKVLSILASVLLLAGCVTSNYSMQNRDKSYLKARSVAPTQIPPGLVSNGFHNFYPVSQKSYPESEKQVSIVPPGLPGAA